MDVEELYTIFAAAALAGLVTKHNWKDAVLYADLAARDMILSQVKFNEEQK